MTNIESQNQIEYVLSKCILSPGDGFILDRMTVPKLIILKKDMKPHIERMDYITYHNTYEALINDIHYKYISTELGFFEIFYKTYSYGDYNEKQKKPNTTTLCNS